MGKRYAVLGGGGSFGVHTALYLLHNASPDRVIGVGRNPLRPAAFTLNVQDYEKYDYIQRHTTYEHDMLMDDLDRLEPEVIINFAAQGEGAASWDHNNWRFYETNAMGLVRLVNALKERDYLERFIQIGTSEMYGSRRTPAAEDAIISPTSPYAISKVAFDMHLEAMFRHWGFPMNVIRPSNAYCPGQLLHRLIPRAILCGLSGLKLPLEGGGKAEKSYIHARDLARAIHLVSQKAPFGEIYNAGPPNPTSIRNVVELCATALGVAFDDLCEMAPGRKTEDARYWLDSSKIRHAVGWFSQIGWEEGLGEMTLWGKTHIDTLRNWPTGYTLHG